MTPSFDAAPGFERQPGIVHGFFGRDGGVSDGDFSSLNCSLSMGDVPGNVAANRAAALGALGLGSELALVRQVHSANAVAVSAPFGEAERPEADGLVSKTPGLALGILTADCAPILLADPDARVIGACHAGWRGALGGIVEATVALMCDIGADRTHIIAAIGPAISAANYEVGPDWAADFLGRNPAHARFISTPEGGREHFDLVGFVRAALASSGIEAADVVGGCTYANPGRYFSHRLATHRGTATGRQIALIALTNGR